MTNTRFKVGDRVIIARNSHKEENDGFNYDYFDEYVGKETVITSMNGENVDGLACYCTDLDYDPTQKLSVCETDIELA